ncbi:MAG: hypothetical protein LC099_00845 [Anaerolineales bacterium]|nr:hypothetical protein [Anaerolineales bacterium]
MNRSLKYLPRLQDVFFIALFLAVLALGSRMINLDGDLPRHLTFGGLILSERHIPPTEPLIYPYENRPYTSHEWLSQTLYAWVYSVGGLPALVLVAALLLSTTFYLLYAYLVERFSLRLPTLFIVAWGAVASSLNWAIRPHLFSMFLFALCLIWADRLRRGERISVWRFPVLMILWSNLHGIFIAGILILLSFAVGWAVDYAFGKRDALATGKRLWLALILAVGGSLLNPGLADSWFRILGFVNNPYLMSRMLEANPPNFQLPEMRIILAFIAFSVFLLAVKRNPLSSGQGFLLAGFSAMSLMSFRNVQLYGIAAPFVLTEALVSLRDFPLLSRLENTLANVENKISGAVYPVAAALLLGLVVLLSPLSKVLYQFEAETFPVEAVQWLKVNPQTGNMFNELNWGGYLELNLHPQKTFADSVADVTGEVTMDYEIILTLGAGWQNLMQTYNVQWVILRPDEPLVRALTSQGWQTLYEDNTAAILRR